MVRISKFNLTRNFEKDSKQYKKYLSKLPSRVLFYQDKHGDINSKYSGESERNIGSIFKYCKEISKQLSKTVFLFFDEGDTFFGKVSVGGEGYGSVAASNIRCELAARLGAPISEDYPSIFVFTASNRFIDFDDCFKRRFGVQHLFFLPYDEKRDSFFRLMLDGYGLEKNPIQNLIDLSKDKSQAFMSEQLKKYIDYNDETMQSLFNYDDFVKYLSNLAVYNFFGIKLDLLLYFI